MSVSRLKKRLNSISTELSNELSLLSLEHILSSPKDLHLIFATKPLRTLLEKVSNSLRHSILPASLYHLIQATFHSNDPVTTIKSVHDLEGNFLWADQDADLLFGKDFAALQSSNLFSLMDEESRQSLYMKQGKFLIDCHRPKVLTFRLSSSLREVSSRCSVIIYQGSAGDYEMGVLAESRPARHFLGKTEWTASPVKSEKSGLTAFTPIFYESPSWVSPLKNKFFGKRERRRSAEFAISDQPMEETRITPFLQSGLDFESKRKKMDSLDVSEFR